MSRSLLSVLFLWTAVLAQTGGEVDITSEPHHHLALQNPYVRVFQVEVTSQQSTMMHRHRHDYVFVTVGNTEIENTVAGKSPVRQKLEDGQTMFVPGSFAHSVKTVSASPFRNVTIELMQDEQSRQKPSAKWDQERGLNIVDGGTEDILFVKDGVRVADVQLQAGAMIPAHRHPGPHLVVAVSDLQLRTSPTGRTSKPIELKAGDVKWIAAGPAHTLMNLGKQPARFITVEFGP